MISSNFISIYTRRHTIFLNFFRVVVVDGIKSSCCKLVVVVPFGQHELLFELFFCGGAVGHGACVGQVLVLMLLLLLLLLVLELLIY